jgi:hypothetical protein
MEPVEIHYTREEVRLTFSDFDFCDLIKIHGGQLNGCCHHDMARPLVADGGDGFQICMVATNIYVKAVADVRRKVVLQFKGWSYG